MKRRLISLFMTVMVVTCFMTACDVKTSQNGNTEISAESGDVLSGKKIGVCIYQFADNYMALFRDELKKSLEEQGISEDNIIIMDSLNNHDTQVNQVKELIKDGVDVLIVNPVNPSFAKDITDLAVQAEIPLVYVNREPDGDEEDRWVDNDYHVSYVGCDARQSGTYQGEIIEALGFDTVDLNGDGKIQYYMIEGDPENIDSQYRTEYSIRTLKDAAWQLDCVGDEVGNWHQETARQLMAKALEEDKDIEVVFCNNDAMALGALEAIEADGRTVGQDIFLVGVDALEEAVEYVIDGRITGTVFNDYISQSHSAADTAINYIKMEKVEHYVGCHYVKVTTKNAQEILDKLK
ncbi:methyl-galactoside transport system substrate-binding protein [Butyrivibrio proteoclasticus]|uniref:Methyl-galactoside transport system substrate-binding protein n=1 Tax=Butyrivibrio proteoclasticus TaxID=43305 RepID=A0A1I5XX83_9FIRM|nr:substrate-binding domain-containing protein [Butyrivibrio proteoclasticus]SFQ36558.1 methyl-galactoside transport system substrate-binding protein [Butyrivibrio proteoclasticus]